MIVCPKSWGDFQHYKDRSPPWIKLHKSLLDNYEFHSLPVASRALAPCLWLLASEHIEGHIDATPKKLAFRLRMTEREAADALKPLIDNGFFFLVQGASNALAERKPDAMPETETETEKEKEKKVSPPDGVSIKVWSDFLKLRKALKAPVTETALEGIKREALKAGVSLEQALTVCVERSWRGFKADWMDNSAKPLGVVAGAI